MHTLPLVGVLAWWLLGRSHLERKRLRRKRARWQVRKGFAYLRPEKVVLPAARVTTTGTSTAPASG